MQKLSIVLLVLVIAAVGMTSCSGAAVTTPAPTYTPPPTPTATPTVIPTPLPPPVPIVHKHSDWNGRTVSALCLEIEQTSNVDQGDADLILTERSFFSIVGDIVQGLGMLPVFDDSPVGTAARQVYRVDTTSCDATLSIFVDRQALAEQYRRLNELGQPIGEPVSCYTGAEVGVVLILSAPGRESLKVTAYDRADLPLEKINALQCRSEPDINAEAFSLIRAPFLSAMRDIWGVKALIVGTNTLVSGSKEGQDVGQDSILLLGEMGPQAREAVPALMGIVEKYGGSYCDFRCSITCDALKAITGQSWTAAEEWIAWWEEVGETY